MKINSIAIENILSIESANVNFEDTGLVLVEGWNHDSDRSNGAGKSALFNSISFALYDRLPRKITATEILRRGSKQGNVTVNFTNGEDEWSVTRSRPKNVIFYKNKIQQNITQIEFENIIGLSYEQFLLTIYNPQGLSDRFIMCSDSDKKTFLLKLLNLEKFDIYKKASDSRCKSILDKINELSNKKELLLSKIEVYQESLVDKDSIEHQIKQIEEVIGALNKKIEMLSSIEKPDLSKYSSIEEDIRKKLNNVSAAKIEKDVLYDVYKELSLSLSKEKCEECGSSIAKNPDHVEKINAKLKKVTSKINNLDDILNKKQEIDNVNKKLIEKKKKESLEYDLARNEIANLSNTVTINSNKIEMLKLKLDKNTQLNNKINDLVLSMEKHSVDIQQNMRELEFYKTISAFYSSTGAQAYVLDFIVDYFNECVKKYIDIVWSNAGYELLSYRENSKGETVAKFSENLTIDSKPVSIGSLSGGELKALSLCVDLSLIDVLDKQFGIRVNPIILDEPFDGLDNSGKEIVISLLSEVSKEKQILIVDHASESKSMFSKVISVFKKNGISALEINM